ncbi:Gfo/Idh/MocA family protein [Streptomyces sp. MAR4 CNX-425]|uniref:Gfo/Idh/MocA family protein n=1 Tax=Streptomyces sp. MAR4 CNX-425 TaxID=3406343 RepID=UPI003B507304
MRFGLLGTGPWAERAHGPGLQAHPRAEIAGVWGRRPEAARAVADRFSTRAYDDVDALFAECDAVAVALPPDVQAPLAERAAAAGCHLLLDKPVATDVAAARRVVEAVERAGVASVVFFTLRFREETARWLAERAGEEGWQLGRADWLSPVFAGSDSPFAASPWRGEKGALWDVGPHALSMLLPVLGEVDPAAPGAVTAARGPGDTVHLTLRHDAGASSTCTLTHTMPAPAAGVTVQLHGSSGVRTAPDRDDEGPVPAFVRAVDALLEAAGSGRPDPRDVRLGLRVTEILAAAERQLSTGG